MATGFYGTVRCADFDVKDCEIYYTYSPDYTTDSSEVLKLDPIQVLRKLDDPDDSGLILGGLYKFVMPTSIFNRKGIYNIMFRPRRIRLRISDCGVLASKPNIKGIIFDLQGVSADDVFRFENNGLIGYVVEYVNTAVNVTEKKVQNFFRVITSNNRVEPISENLTNTTQKGIRYRLNDNSTLTFCTLSPSSASSVKPDVKPFLGLPNQEVFLYPSFFDPMSLEINLVEHDFDTIAIGLFGNQTKSVEDGVRTYYDEDGKIYKQFNEYVIQEETTSDKLFEVKEERTNIDFSKDFNNIKQ
jgi:hypothetical protein